MFDNLPFKTTDEKTINSFIESGLLSIVDEKVDYDKETGEQFTIQKRYKYYNLFFTLNYSSKDVYKELKCKGSFHYLMNEGKHNADLINYVTAIRFLLKFAEVFNIDLAQLIIGPPEIGQNTKLDSWIKIEEVIQFTLFEERKEFSYNPPHVKTSVISGKPTHENRIKRYSKTHDCPKYAIDNLLRDELKFLKTRWLNKIGIFSIADLLVEENWKKLMKKHIEDLNQIVLYDYTIKPPNNSRIKHKLNQYKTHKYWRDLVEKCRLKTCSYDTYNDKIKDLNKLSKKYGSNLKEHIMTLVENQWHWFFENKDYPKYAQLYFPIHAPFIECMDFNKNNSFKKKCPITGLSLQHEKKSAKYITTKTIYHLKKNDIQNYLLLCSLFISNKGIRPKFERSIESHLAKQIRNRYYYKNTKKHSRYRQKQYKNQLSLDIFTHV